MDDESSLQESFDEVIGVFSSLPLAVDQIIAPYQGIPIVGSQASKEFSEIPGDEGVKTTYNLALIEIQAAADHMFAMEKALTSGVLSYAPWSIARAVLELTALTTWLLEPTLSPSERIGRGMTFRLQSFNDEIRFGREIKEKSPEQSELIIDEAEKGIDRLLQDAVIRKIPEVLNKKGRIIGFHGKFPDTLSLIKTSFGDADFYRLLSGLAHGRPWAAMSLTMPNIRRTKIISPEITINQVLFLLEKCINWYARPIWDFSNLQGWDLEGLTACLETEYDKAYMPLETRFWRT